MSRPLLARLEPRLSVYPPGDVEQPLAGTVAAWTSEEAAQSGSIGRNLVATIVATARLPHGARFARQAVVRFKAHPQGREVPFQVLTWETPDGWRATQDTE